MNSVSIAFVRRLVRSLFLLVSLWVTGGLIVPCAVAAEMRTSGSDEFLALGSGRTVQHDAPVQIATGVVQMEVLNNLCAWVTQDGGLWLSGEHPGPWFLGSGFPAYVAGDPAILPKPTRVATQVKFVVLQEIFLLYGTTSGDLYLVGSYPGGGGRGTWSAPLLISKDVVEAKASPNFILFRKSDNSLWSTGHTFSVSGSSYSLAQTKTAQLLNAHVKAFDVILDRFLYIDANDALWGFGANTLGALGVGDTNHRAQAVQILPQVKSFRAYPGRTYAIDKSDNLWVFGDGGPSSGVVSMPTHTAILSPKTILTQVADVRLSERQSQWAGSMLAVLRTDGSVWILGDGPLLQLKVFAQSDTKGNPNDTGLKAAQVFAGLNRLALISKEGAASWAGIMSLDGETETGKVSAFKPAGASVGSLPPLESLGHAIKDLRILSTGFLLQKTDGTLWGQGIDYVGGFGQSTAVITVPSFPQINVVAASAGRQSSLFLSKNNELFAVSHFPENVFSLSGTDLIPSSKPQLLVTRVQQVQGLASGYFYRRDDGTVWVSTWANNNLSTYYSPHLTNGVPTGHTQKASGATQIFGHSQSRACFYVDANHQLWAFGSNSYGQLGTGSTASWLDTPEKVTDDVSEVSVSETLTAILKRDGSVWVSGNLNAVGLTSASGATASAVPVKLTSDATQVLVSGNSVLWVDRAGVIRVKGFPSFALGSGGEAVVENKLRAVSNPKRMRAAYGTFGVVDAGGQSWFMGENSYGQFGNGTTTNSTELVKGPAGVLDLDLSATHTVFLMKDQAPTFTTQPVSQTVNPGASVTLSYQATGSVDSIQWYRDGQAIAGATGATLTVTAVGAWEGVYTVVVTNSGGSTTSSGARLRDSTKPAFGRPINVSVLGTAGEKENTLIAGFMIQGSGKKRVLIRVSGPALAPYTTNYVADPQLRVLDAAGVEVGFNDNWPSELSPLFKSSPWSVGSKDAAVLVDLSPGRYDIHVLNTGKEALALVEVFDLYENQDSYLYNISCRLSQNPDVPLILGLVMDSPSPLLVRNGGASLREFGLTTAAADTRFTVFNQQSLKIAENDNFDFSLDSLFKRLGAYSYPQGKSDAALMLENAPSTLTVHAFSQGGSGVGLCEIYLAR